jgi:hypothetical protein
MALPQPPPDVERFFRAQGEINPNLVDQSSLAEPGTYWTKDLGSAYRYQAEAPGRRVMFVDVPKSELFRQGITGDYEVKMPREFSQRFNPRYIDELTEAMGDRGAASLRGIAPMLSLPILLGGNALGVPEPLTRAAAGATALSPFGPLGMLGGAVLGGLSSQVDERSLLGQVLGSIL